MTRDTDRDRPTTGPTAASRGGVRSTARRGAPTPRGGKRAALDGEVADLFFQLMSARCGRSSVTPGAPSVPPGGTEADEPEG